MILGIHLGRKGGNRAAAISLLVILAAVAGAGCQRDTEQASSASKAKSAAGAPAQSVAPSEPARVASAARHGIMARADVLSIEGFVPQEQVRVLLGQTPTRVGPLSGQEPSPSYNALRYHGVRAEDLGLAVQVWKLADANAAVGRLESLRAQHLGVQPPPSGAIPASFVAERSGVRTYTLAPEGTPFVVAISCSTSVCGDDWSGLVTLGARMGAELSKPAQP